jgi:outer membrane protein
MKRLFLLAVVSVLLVSCQQEKSAYVNSSKLFDEYQPIKDASAKFEKQQKNAQGQIQPQMQKLQQEYQQLMQRKESMDQAAFQKEAQAIQQKAQQMQQMQQMQMQSLQKNNTAKMDSLNQAVKKAVADYAESNGYTYVFGMSEEGKQIIYASEGKNITQEVLEELNGGEMDSSEKEDKDEMKSEKEMDSTMPK